MNKKGMIKKIIKHEKREIRWIIIFIIFCIVESFIDGKVQLLTLIFIGVEILVIIVDVIRMVRENGNK